MIEYGIANSLPSREELFDLTMDPTERVNLTENHACERVLTHMRARLDC